MYTLILLLFFVHSEPVFYTFDMPDLDTCEVVAEEILISVRGDQFYLDDEHWCINIYAELE